MFMALRASGVPIAIIVLISAMYIDNRVYMVRDGNIRYMYTVGAGVMQGNLFFRHHVCDIHECLIAFF
jgi:hypothetical protein